LLLKKEKVSYQLEISRKLGFTEKTVREWFKIYNEGGINSLLEMTVGGNRESLISEEIKSIISEKLNDILTTITSNVELQVLLERENNFNVKYYWI